MNNQLQSRRINMYYIMLLSAVIIHVHVLFKNILCFNLTRINFHFILLRNSYCYWRISTSMHGFCLIKKNPTDSLSNKIFHKYSICMTPVKLHKHVKFNLTSTSKGTTYNKTEIKVKFDQLLKC